MINSIFWKPQFYWPVQFKFQRLFVISGLFYLVYWVSFVSSSMGALLPVYVCVSCWLALQVISRSLCFISLVFSHVSFRIQFCFPLFRLDLFLLCSLCVSTSLVILFSIYWIFFLFVRLSVHFVSISRFSCSGFFFFLFSLSLAFSVLVLPVRSS